MAKRVKGTHHVALKCKGTEAFEKAVSFYVDILGMEIVRSWGEGTTAGIMLDTGNSLMEIFADAEEVLPQGAVRHFALATDDVDDCVAAVRKAGYQITQEPTDIVIPATPEFPVRIAFCVGPAGEEIEFFCER